MARLFRIARTIHASNPNQAFDGEGAFRGGSRWNTPGHRLSFSSTSLSLAQLEHLAQIDWLETEDDELTLVEGFLDDRFVEVFSDATLPRDWRQSPPSASSQRFGDEWLLSGSSVALSVPSAVVEGERSVLINPAHPNYARVRVDSMRPFAFDGRLWRTQDK